MTLIEMTCGSIVVETSHATMKILFDRSRDGLRITLPLRPL